MASNSKNMVYVVTGGNRGLGLGLAKALLTRPNTTVIATVRNEQKATELKDHTASIATGSGSTLHIVQLDFSTAVAPEKILEAVKKVGVDHIDVLINNAGFAQPMVPASETTAEDLRAAFEVNTIAPLLVFQGLKPMLEKVSSPKLIMVSSSVGSIAEMESMPGGAYGPSRAAQNWLTKALHQENKNMGLIAIALHPGWVQTNAGQFVADQWGFVEGPPDTVETSVEGMLKVIDEATQDSSGKFITQKGEILGW
jgi:NAD(P)-dependent dehydrogenase (short-subunit alcohol dehydrogenase family)